MNEDRKRWSRAGEPVRKQEKIFVGRFALVAVAIHAVILGVAGLAWAIDRQADVTSERREVTRGSRDANGEQRRVAPGRVATDAPQRAAPVPAGAAARPPLSGEQVVAQVCSACHTPGLLEAPKVGDRATWQARAAAHGGVDGLVQAAIVGKGNMPPRGGRPDLTDAEVAAAVKAMAAL